MITEQETENTEEEALKIKDEPGLYKRFMAELSLADKDAERWRNDAKVTVDRYALEQRQEESFAKTKFNLLWSNVETLKPATYLSPGKPEVSRRFKDKDPIGRLASILLERCGYYLKDKGNQHETVKKVRNDVLLPGMGQARVFLENTFMQDELVSQYPMARYVHYFDFQFSPTRAWDETRWVSFKSYMSRDELRERFGKKAANVKLTHGPKNWSKDDYGAKPPSYLMQAEVYELWHKYSGRVFWFSPGKADSFLDVKDDPLGLEGFFPCPKPLLATITNNSLRPIPDYIYYREQARDIDILTQRICSLERMIRYAGVHNPAIPELSRIVTESVENRLIAASNWTMYQEAGGYKGNTETLPIEEMVSVLVQLYQARDSKIQDVYQITGISDVIRGQNNPMESATATQGKIQFATLRLQDRQQSIAMFDRDLLELQLEVASKHLSDEMFWQIGGMDLLDQRDQANFPQAMALIRDDMLRNFRIDIETDSTIAADEETRKKQGMEFLQATSTFFDKVAQASMSMPDMVPIAGEILTYTARLFKQGRAMEATIEAWLDDIKAKIEAAQQQPPAPPPPDPAMIQVQNDFQIEQGKLQVQAQELQIKAREVAVKEAEVQLEREKLMVEREKIQTEAQVQITKIESERETAMQQALLPVAENGSSKPPVMNFFGSPTQLRAKFATNELGEREALVTEEPILEPPIMP